MKQQTNQQLKDWNTMLLVLAITFIIVTLLLLGIRYYESNQMRNNNFIIPKQYNGVWLSISPEDPLRAIAVFDLTQEDQAQVAKQVDSFFKQRNIQQP